MYLGFGFVYVKLNMAVSLVTLFFVMKYVLHFIGFKEHNVRVEGIRVQGITAIFNLTLMRPYAILLSDYPNR